MKEWILDTPVMLTFFTRHETLMKVFNKIHEVRPRTLFLVGDGPRLNNLSDKENIEKCKKILENIDWKCDVHRYYSELNRGILINATEGFEKAFSLVDRLIFLEDDMLPSKSFFYFCSELLEKYKNDLRIQAISGINLFEQYGPDNYDYFFSRRIVSGACAFWKRTYENRNNKYDYFNDKYVMHLIKQNMPKSMNFILKNAYRDKIGYEIDNKPKSIETISIMNLYLQSGCYITPSKNLTVSIGISIKSAHTTDNINKMPKGIRKFFQLKTFEYEFPLRHPKNVMNDINYEKKCERLFGEGYPLVRFHRKIVSFLLIAKYDGIFVAFRTTKKRMRRFILKESDING